MTGSGRSNSTAAAARPPADLPGLDPAWSRLVDVPDGDGHIHRWHLLDSAPDARPDQPTLLCVHGNPTWSYLWRRLLADPPTGWRVVAPDQLGMGYSQRLDRPRRLAQRVEDLAALTATLGLTGPVVTVAHDWGGIISLGWALEHRAQLRGVVLTNTAVHQPENRRPPVLIRVASVDGLRAVLCVRTQVFVRAATALSRPPLPANVRAAFAAPYRGADRRRAVGEFVADIPFGEHDPSRPALDRIASGIRSLDVPALLLWGPRDPVFGTQYLHDLLDRLPNAAVHRYPSASHLLPEDAPTYAADVARWVDQLSAPGSVESEPVRGAAGPAAALERIADPDLGTQSAPPLWAALEARAAATPDDLAAAEVDGPRITWRELSTRVADTAAALVRAGVRPAQRVALLVPPSIELTVAVYAVWRAGAVIVVADKGLGLRAMGRALRSADVDAVIATPVGLAAAEGMRLPGLRLLLSSGGLGRAIGVSRLPLTVLAGAPASAGTLPPPVEALPEAAANDEAAVVFTSGATGPAKGVVYRHRQIQAQLALIRTAYAIGDADRIVAAFAPFALYGPALGVASAVPDTEVTAPHTLTAAALADAVAAVEATVVFASPAALANVVATAPGLSDAGSRSLSGVRLLMSAGAPVPVSLLQAVHELMPAAELHTPYGMTEALPVTDVDLAELEKAGSGDGVCVGRPLPGVQVALGPLDALGCPQPGLIDEPGISGEVCVRAAHVKDRYDGLWATQSASAQPAGWHRTGDVGRFDADGRLWIQGRRPHLITTAEGLVTPVGLEQRAESVPGVRQAAVVGVGPAGTQQVVVVVVTEGPSGPAPRPTRLRRRPRLSRARRPRVADLDVSDAVRAAVGRPVAAVLTVPHLPLDVRHRAKIDRAAVGRAAATVLAGRR